MRFDTIEMVEELIQDDLLFDVDDQCFLPNPEKGRLIRFFLPGLTERAFRLS